MPERIIIIGADAPALNGVLKYIDSRPAEAVVLYPEENPLPEFSCSAIEQYLGRGIDFPERLRALGVDTQNRRVLVRDIVSGSESDLEYDQLVFATAAAPSDLDVPGEHLTDISRIATDEDARRLRPIDGKTVVVGSGHNLLLTVSALMQHGRGEIEIVSGPCPQGFDPLSGSLMDMLAHHMSEKGVTIHEGHEFQRIERDKDGLRVVTDQATISADRIINAQFSRPLSAIAADAGLEIAQTGAVIVNESLHTNISDIFACGSCAAFKNVNCKTPIPGTAIRSTELRQATVLAASLAGAEPVFAAPACAYSVKLGDLTAAGAGLTVDAARRCGFTAMSSTVIQFDRAHFMPDAALMTLELVFDGPTRRVLGIQGISTMGDALSGRISAVSAMLTKKPYIEDVANLEVAYSPPFASAMDVLNTAANVADNMLAGINSGIDAREFRRLWDERENGDHFFLDCRELGNAQPFLERHPLHWNHIPQGELARRLDEVPEDSKIVLVCNTGTRSYEAQVTLRHAGFEDVINVDGGMSALRQSGVKL